MRYGFFTMPMHPPHRAWVETLKEDREAFILADQLGFHDGFVGEHLTDKAENVTNSFQFLATLIPVTRTIKLATGTSNISQSHPVLIAAHAAMFDHLAEGRFIFGVSPGSLPADAEVLGQLGIDRNRLFLDAIEAIIAVWSGDPPYDFDRPGNRFKITTANMGRAEFALGEIPKPFQKPFPEIVGTVVTPNSQSAHYFGTQGFHPISANFLLPKWVKTHWTSYAAGCAAAGRLADRAHWRVAKTIFVADDDRVAESYGASDAHSPYRFYYSHMLKKFRAAGRLFPFKEDAAEADASVTDDAVIDRLVIRGSVNKVVDEILAFHDEIGPFGELVYGGVDWTDPKLAKRSMQLFAEQVMPRVNAALQRPFATAV